MEQCPRIRGTFYYYFHIFYIFHILYIFYNFHFYTYFMLSLGPFKSFFHVLLFFAPIMNIIMCQIIFKLNFIYFSVSNIFIIEMFFFYFLSNYIKLTSSSLKMIYLINVKFCVRLIISNCSFFSFYLSVPINFRMFFMFEAVLSSKFNDPI